MTTSEGLTAPEIFERAIQFTEKMRACVPISRFGQESLIVPSPTVEMKQRARDYPKYPDIARRSISEIRNSVMPAFSLTGLTEVSTASMDDYLFLTIGGYPEPMITVNPILVNKPHISHKALWEAASATRINLELQPSGTTIRYYAELQAKIIEGKFILEKHVARTVPTDASLDAADCILFSLTKVLCHSYNLPIN